MSVGLRNLWVLVTRAPDLPGKWVAHCLDFDLVTQGDSMDHAFEMAREAVAMVVQEDAAEGLDPFKRESAPDEDWQQLWALQRFGVPMAAVPRESRHEILAAARQLQVRVREVFVSSSQHKPTAGDLFGDAMPEAWQVAALEDLRNGRDSRNSCPS